MRINQDGASINKLNVLINDFGSVHKNAVFYGSQFFKASVDVTSPKNKTQNKSAKYFKGGYYIEYIAREEAVSKDDRNKVYDLFGNELSLTLAKAKMAKLDDGQFIWENVLSFDNITKKMIDFSDKKIIAKLISRPLYDFWKYNGMNPKNIDLIFSIHQNTDHPHVHFAFWEKEKTYKLRIKKGQERSFRFKANLKKETFLKFKQDVFKRILEVQNEKQLYTSNLVNNFKHHLEYEFKHFEDKDYANAYQWVKDNQSSKRIYFKNLNDCEKKIILAGVRSVFKHDSELISMVDEYYKQTEIINLWMQNEINEFNTNQKIATKEDDKSNYNDLAYNNLDRENVTEELDAKFANAFIKSLKYKAKKANSVWFKKCLDDKSKAFYNNTSFDVDLDKAKKFKARNYKTRALMHQFFRDSFDKLAYLNGKIFEYQQQRIVEHLRALNEDKSNDYGRYR
ncbi:relaxase MobL [[Mycoplasma] imitans]|uniref:relaxase MobL n=1 Tax=[Mycoplasma] imitans TaxID=29560 RepID=UPI0004889CB1|nr:relaxase MobL [[Mycoplasma] imitans]